MGDDIEKIDETSPKLVVHAPGHPGREPHWTTGAKVAVGASVTPRSRVWFTLSRGVLNEIYFPDIDRANTRSVRFLVSDGAGFLSDEEADTDTTITTPGPGLPAFRISNLCRRGRYCISKEVVTDPDRDALLLKVSLDTAATEHRLFLFAEPHVVDRGAGNNATAGQYKGIPMLFAQRAGITMAIGCSIPFVKSTVGFLGLSDGFTQLRQTGELRHIYTEALSGNVALTAEVDWRTNSEFSVAIAFGQTNAEAAQQARAGLSQAFPSVRDKYVQGWNEVLDAITGPPDRRTGPDLYRTSIATCRIHESKRFPGAFVASLSIPWGCDRTDGDIGGYHVLWPRDLCEAALALLAAGDEHSAQRALFYLQCTQEADGSWSQNMWLDGTAHWTSTQMDGIALPILLADSLRRSNLLGEQNPWPMIKRAVGFLISNGPVTKEDRWESVSGYSPYTMAVEVAALLAASDFAVANGEHAISEFLLVTADAWNEQIDELTYFTRTQLAERHGVAGYYVRISPPDAISGNSLRELTIDMQNQPEGEKNRLAGEIVSPDALGLVRFGLRSPLDPRIVNTVNVIDATLKTETGTGPVWHRFTHDGYGELADGSPYNKKVGIGRGWPLLAGERAQYEIAAGNLERAEGLQQTIERQTTECGLIPEQVWDTRDLPERGLYSGRPTGSGCPLVWAHAEYIRLVLALRNRHPWNIPPQTVARYVSAAIPAGFQIWTSKQQRKRIRPDRDLRIDCPASSVVEWTTDDWHTSFRSDTTDSDVGVHWTVLSTRGLAAGRRVRFRISGTAVSNHRDNEYEVVVVNDQDLGATK